MRFLAVAVVLSACAPENIVLGRPYELRVPADSDGQTPLPVLVLAHGFGVNGVVQDFVFQFSKEVDRKHFIYVMPSGTQDALGHRFWNATDACCDFDDIPVDDVAFFRALVEDVKAKHPVQAGHVFYVGHSNGAFMGLRLACDAPELFDGIVAVSGSTWNDATRCGDGQANPLLLVHGTEDTTIPYDGKPGLYPGEAGTSSRFAHRAGCTGPFEETERADFVGNADAETKKERATGCPSGSAVELWTVEGAGHVPEFDARWTSATFEWLQEHSR